MEWSNVETEEWFSHKLWNSHCKALKNPDGDSLARMCFARILRAVQAADDAEDIFKSVGGIIANQRRNSILNEEEVAELNSCDNRGDMRNYKYMYV